MYFDAHWIYSKTFSSVQSFSRVRLSVTPWTTALQASLSITNSQSLHKLMSIDSVMPSNHLTLCRPFLLPPSIFPSIRVFSKELTLCISWPKYYFKQLINFREMTGWTFGNISFSKGKFKKKWVSVFPKIRHSPPSN